MNRKRQSVPRARFEAARICLKCCAFAAGKSQKSKSLRLSAPESQIPASAKEGCVCPAGQTQPTVPAHGRLRASSLAALRQFAQFAGAGWKSRIFDGLIGYLDDTECLK